jgi:hypothetical protein
VGSDLRDVFFFNFRKVTLAPGRALPGYIVKHISPGCCALVENLGLKAVSNRD